MSFNAPEFAIFQRVIKLQVTDALWNKQSCWGLTAKLASRPNFGLGLEGLASFSGCDLSATKRVSV